MLGFVEGGVEIRKVVVKRRCSRQVDRQSSHSCPRRCSRLNCQAMVRATPATHLLTLCHPRSF